MTVGGGLESSLKYNMSDEFSAGINFSINAYGNVPKSFDSILYKTDDVTKTDIATLQYEKASPEETDQSCFGLIDATISVGATIKL